MKRLFVICAVMLSLSIFQGSHDTTSAQEPPPDICFPEVPGIVDCVSAGVQPFYLSDPVLHDEYPTRLGISLEQAVWLWGYPLTDLHFERNADGDCVLTQWFERAVFEFHEVYARWFTDFKLRRLGAEMHGDTNYTPAFCTLQDHVAER